MWVSNSLRLSFKKITKKKKQSYKVCFHKFHYEILSPD